MKNYTLHEISTLVNFYLSTLDNEEHIELYTTEKDFQSMGLGGFLEFLNHKEERIIWMQTDDIELITKKD